MKQRKKLQDDVLFEEQDTANAEAPGYMEPVVDDSSLRLLQMQKKLLDNYDKLDGKMAVSEEKMAGLSDCINSYSQQQDLFVKAISENFRMYFGISPEALNDAKAAIREEVVNFKTEIHQITTSEISRLRNAYRDVENDIDVIRIRWWPHGYILILIIMILFCLCLFLIKKVLTM